jgi:hypothetical protein
MGSIKKQVAVHTIPPLREEKKNANILPVLEKERDEPWWRNWYTRRTQNPFPAMD